MARDGSKHWDDDDRYYSSGSHSDDSPILSYRYDKYRRYAPYVREIKAEDRERRSTLTVLAKFFLFSTAMILFCVLMYIPVYNKVNYQLPKGAVAGWSVNTNRDTKIYVQPNNVTTIHEPKDVCTKQNENTKNKLFLLIVVCSSTTNFENRIAIRETWGSYKNYRKISKVFRIVRDKYKNYNYSYDLYPNVTDLNVTGINGSVTDNITVNFVNVTVKNNVTSRAKRDIPRFSELLPELAKALQSSVNNIKTDTVPENEERRFDDDDSMLPEFDMNKELGGHTEANYDYDYEESNVMKIPPKGYEDTQDLEKILTLFKHSKSFPDIKENLVDNGNTDPDFKLVFLLGLPQHDNDSDTQGRIDEEVQKYGDIIQEGFIDSYNNLTLKSIMMLKWVTNVCKESVRYILKTDDDMYINVPNLVLNLRNRSKEFDSRVQRGREEEEYLLIGDLICGAKPVLDSRDKWYSPRYMYGGRVYPRYLSGTGYALSAPAARALYAAALRTHYFHLEDIYITGMCSLRATPRITPRDDPLFSYRGARTPAPPCWAHAHASAHRVPPPDMRALHARLMRVHEADRCERMRLTQVRRDRMRPKVPPKKQKLTKFSLVLT